MRIDTSAGKCFTVTCSTGFIGSAVARHLIYHTQYCVINLDKLIYTGNLEPLAEADCSDPYHFQQVDINDTEAIERFFSKYRADLLIQPTADLPSSPHSSSKASRDQLVRCSYQEDSECIGPVSCGEYRTWMEANHGKREAI